MSHFSPLLWLCAVSAAALNSFTALDPTGAYEQYLDALGENMRSFMVAGITMILSILPIIGQLYALFLSFITIFLDDREHIKGSYSDNEEDDMSIRELIVQMMKDDFEEE